MNGNAFIMPPMSDTTTDTQVLEYPIVSVTLPTTSSSYSSNFTQVSTVRQALRAFQDGYVDGTDGNDTINATYAGDLDGDRVDNNDAILPGVTPNSNDDFIRAGLGNDIVWAGAGADSVRGNEGNDTLYGYTSPTVDEGANDSLDGGAGSDQLFGGGGNDLLIGGAGTDTLDGGTGSDTLYGDDTLGTDTTGGADSIVAGAGNDSVVAGIGNDTVIGGAGLDTISGDAGNDSLYGDDTAGTGAGDADSILGGAGDDLIIGGAAGDSLSGGEGTDTIYGDDTLGTSTLGGADRIDAGAGDDSVVAGVGNDTVIGGLGMDTISGGADNDTLYGDDTLGTDSTGGADSIDAGAGNDRVEAGAGNDSVVGGAGSDVLVGNAGDDTLHGDDTAGSDTAGGDDALYGLDGNDLLNGGHGNDTLDGGLGDDRLLGGEGNDSLWAREGNDSLDGGNGNDVLDGGAGIDTLVGGLGRDSFVASSGDLIQDFNTGTDAANRDFVDLSGYYNQDNLDAWNAANPNQQYKTPLAWMRADQRDDGRLNMMDGLNGLPTMDLRIQAGGAAVDAIALENDNTNVVCFGADALILTDQGQVAAGELAVGDMVMTRDAGLQPIRWIGRRALTAAELDAAPNLRPIRIKAGALGRNTPEADLIVSPQHRVLVRSRLAQRLFGAPEVLVAAKQLLLVEGIDIAEDLGGLTYVHFLFDDHQVVWSNGAETESLHPGRNALDMVGKAGREEIFAIFPALRDEATPRPGARVLASGRMGRKLAMRHIQNNKPLVS